MMSILGCPATSGPKPHAPAIIETRNADFWRRWGTDRLYGDYRAMVEKEHPDLVCVATRMDFDLSGSGYIVYENGVRAFMSSHTNRPRFPWMLEFIGDASRIISRTEHAHFELWGRRPETGELIHASFWAHGTAAVPW